MVGIVNNTAFHLKERQTPSADELAEKGLNLLTYNASLETENAEWFKAFSNYIAAHVHFPKTPIVKVVKSSNLDFINRLRHDSVLKLKYTGGRTGKKGAPKKFAGLADVYNFNPNCSLLDLSNEEIAIYLLVTYSWAFKMDIKLAIAIFYKQGEEMARNNTSLMI